MYLSLENHITMNAEQNTRPSISGNSRVLRIPGGKTKKTLNIGTWNIRSLYEAGKLNNTIAEMDRLNVDILGVCETWWPNTGDFVSQNAKIYFSGNSKRNHRNGVGIIVKEHIAKSVIGFIPKSDRTMIIKISAKPVNINIIQVYAPTADKSNDEIEAFYIEVEELIKITKPHEITIIQGDFNAKVGSDIVAGVKGIYGLGDRNERGDRLIEFCQEFKMKITNTLFTLPPRRLYTWKSPQDRVGNVIRNQIDFILINRRHCSSVRKVTTYPSADVPSDHNLLMAKMHIKLARQSNKARNRKIDIGKLENPIIRSDVSSQVNTELININRNDVENIWNSVKTTINSIARNTLGNYTKPKSKSWMTEEILQLMDERRKYKNSNYEMYWEINREIQREVRIAKNNHLNSQCQEIERLMTLHDDFQIHKKMKEAAGIYRNTNSSVLYNNNNEPVFETAEKKDIWKEYIQNLFRDSTRSDYDNRISHQMTGEAITNNEVEDALKSLRERKATGPDEIPAEILKMINGDNVDLLTKLFNHIYDTGQYPQDWLKSTFITIPKKSHPKRCNDYRLISLMSHALKIFLKIIHKRIYEKCEREMGETQFGFKEAKGTREALFCVQVLVQKCRDVNKDIFMCFIDYEKAFDTVQHDKLMDILASIGISEKEIRCIKSLYWHQSAHVNIDGEITEEISISKGVRQGCTLSPLLFNIYSEKIFKESVNNVQEGVLINNEYVNNIRYADDTTLIADNLSGLQNLVTRLTACSETYGLRLNTNKTKYMIISKKNNFENMNITIHNTPLERVSSFKYLGFSINDQWDNSKEIKCRIEMARDTFHKYKRVLTSHDSNIATKTRFIKAYIWPVLLYSVEVWTLKAIDVKRLEAFEMWIYRRILKIPWIAHVSNDEVLRRLNKTRELFDHIKRRKISYLGHIMRNPKYRILQRILQAKIEDLDPVLFSFRVKFYPADPFRLTYQGRTILYQQLKRDLRHGRIYCSIGEAAALGSLIVQEELGDYNEEIHTENYVASMNLALRQPESLEKKIMELHKKREPQQNPREVIDEFLSIVSALETYGIDPHPVKDHRGSQLYIGINYSGISTFICGKRSQHFRWNEVQKINFEGKMFIAHLSYTDASREAKKHTVGFKCSTNNTCRYLWRCALEQMLFFTLPNSQNAAVVSGGGFFSWGTKFKYTGRTEREILTESINALREQKLNYSSSNKRKASSVPATPSSPPGDFEQIIYHDLRCQNLLHTPKYRAANVKIILLSIMARRTKTKMHRCHNLHVWNQYLRNQN
ncbi:FERM domain containing isoform X3 [Musca autumnalis]|uniref:FERM domain containing isoform X3 n=1 Tax=Musca autumnalis TaxID=221902 RepID=UPI003CE81D8D